MYKRQVEILANIELPAEAIAARAHGARGIGLYRTEFLFLDRDDVPSEDEQAGVYGDVVEVCGERPVTFRTFDLGGDKFPLFLEIPREEMDRRIDARVQRMLERGLVEEVRNLLAAGYGPGDPGMTGTGYREVARYLAGETTLEEAADRIRCNTRRYARRQLTWFRHQLPEGVVRIDATRELSEQVERVLEAWRSAGGEPTGKAEGGAV